MTTCDRPAERKQEAGFTLVEVLTAIVILVFGLMAVTNLLLIAASSNTVANQTTAATSSASRLLDRLKDVTFQGLVVGGSVAADTGVAGPCDGVGAVAVNDPSTLNNCDDVVPGVGRVHTRWSVGAIPGTARAYFIQVRSEGAGALAGARSRAWFTTVRSCTDTVGGCPP